MLRVTAIVTALLATPLPAASPLRVLEPEAAPPAMSATRMSTVSHAVVKRSSARKGTPVTIDGQNYRSLDEYLARLERDGHVGKAWYKQVRPGVYEFVTNMRPAPEKKLFTRAELEREFGFAN